MKILKFNEPMRSTWMPYHGLAWVRLSVGSLLYLQLSVIWMSDKVDSFSLHLRLIFSNPARRSGGQ